MTHTGDFKLVCMTHTGDFKLVCVTHTGDFKLVCVCDTYWCFYLKASVSVCDTYWWFWFWQWCGYTDRHTPPSSDRGNRIFYTAHSPDVYDTVPLHSSIKRWQKSMDMLDSYKDNLLKHKFDEHLFK